MQNPKFGFSQNYAPHLKRGELRSPAFRKDLNQYK